MSSTVEAEARSGAPAGPGTQDAGLLERLFHLRAQKTSVRTEVVAGFTTFMAMAYILFVNPNVLGQAGMPKDGVFFATAIGAGLATLAMGLFVNYPIALAPGMGLNAFYTYTVAMQMHVPWQVALGCVFISGLVFVILTVTRVRQLIVQAIPSGLKNAITVGIGLFIALIGLKDAGVMAIQDGLPVMGNLTSAPVLVTVIGILLIGALMVLRVRGAVLIGILATMVIGIPFGVTKLGSGFHPVQLPSMSHLIVGQLDIMGALSMGLFTVIFTFTFVELFDSLGTIVGTAQRAGIVDEESGTFPRIGKALTVDALSATGGALLGTSTITAYVESAAGVAAGGRTGLTTVVVGLLFLLSVFFSPIAGIIPTAATAPALVIVGVLMMSAIRKIDFDDWTIALPAFLTMVLMPFTFSVANGVSAGLLVFPLMKLIGGKAREVHWLMWILALVVLARYIWYLG